MGSFAPVPILPSRRGRGRGRATTVPRAWAGIAALLILAAGAAAPARVAAHDYWFEAAGTEWELYRGHKFSEHKDEPIVPYPPQNVRAAFCARADGSVAPVAFGQVYPVRFPADCTALVVDTDSGFWSQTLTGTVNQPEKEVFGVLKSWRALESVKRVSGWNPRLTAPLSGALEVVFTEDPFPLRVGDKLRLRVTLEGRPAAGVTVAYDGKARGVTGSDGSANLRIRHGGEQRIAASIELPLTDGTADKIVHSTILFFALPEETR